MVAADRCSKTLGHKTATTLFARALEEHIAVEFGPRQALGIAPAPA